MIKKEKMGKYIKILSGYPFKSELFNSDGVGMPLIRVRDVNSGFSGQYYSGEYAPEYVIHDGDLLIGLDGDFKCVAWNFGPALLNQRVCKIEIVSNKIDREYLVHFLPEALLDLHSKTTFTTVKHLSTKTISETEIPLPPLDDQKRIAHLLGKVEGLIAQRKQGLAQLDELLKSVFLQMFGDPVRNEKGWDVLPFSKIGKFQSGGTPSKERPEYWEGDFPWVSPKDMKRTYINDSEDHISEKVFSESSLKKIESGNLLIVVRGMILAHSFPVAINTVPVSINQDMKAIFPDDRIHAVYLMKCMQALKRQILALITTAGHGTKKFDSYSMTQLNIPVPPKELQQKFVTAVDRVEKIKDRFNLELTDLESLYKVLSHKAFAGEFDLSRMVVVSN